MPDKDVLLATFLSELEYLKRLPRPDNLESLFKLWKTVVVRAPRIAEDLINNNLQLIESIRSEEAVILFGVRAIYYIRKPIRDAEDYANKALAVERDIKSPTAETWIFLRKGIIHQYRGEYEKAESWYKKASYNSPDFLRPAVLLALGYLYGFQGNYGQAFQHINEAIEKTELLLRNKTLSEEDRDILNWIQTDAWSQLGSVNMGMGDFDEAQKDYDRALELASTYRILWEIYQVQLFKVRLMLMMGKLKEAKEGIEAVERMPVSEIDELAPLYIMHDWARVYRASHPPRFDEAMDKYSTILYGNTSDETKINARLNNLMENQADLFGEILSGIRECLFGLGKVTDAKRLEEVTKNYQDALSECGIYKEIDKNAKLQMEREKVVDILCRIFEKKPLSVRYKDILVTYDRVIGKAKYETKKETGTLPKRAFIILKYLNDHRDEWVTKEELGKSLEDEREAIGNLDMIRGYISRYIRKKLGLNQYLEQRRKKHPEKGGWKLGG